MILDTTKKIELACAKNSDKMNDPYYKDGKLIATDGHILAVIAVDETDDDTQGPVPQQAVKDARRTCGGNMRLQGGTVQLLNGCTVPRGADEGFIGYEKYLPEGSEHTFRVALDARLLLKLAQALGSKGPVALSFKDPQSPILVDVAKGSKDIGLIMPVRL